MIQTNYDKQLSRQTETVASWQGFLISLIINLCGKQRKIALHTLSLVHVKNIDICTDWDIANYFVI